MLSTEDRILFTKTRFRKVTAICCMVLLFARMNAGADVSNKEHFYGAYKCRYRDFKQDKEARKKELKVFKSVSFFRSRFLNLLKSALWQN